MPQLSIKEDHDYLPENTEDLKNRKYEVVEFKLSHHFAFPLNKQSDLEKHDPIAYITGMMTKLDPTELISLQFLLTPTKSTETKKISNIIFYHGDVLEHLNSIRAPGYLKIPAFFIKVVFSLVFTVTMLPFWIISTMMTNEMTPIPHLFGSKPKSDRVRTPFEDELVESVHTKIKQPLFEATIRLLVIVKNKHELSERIGGIISSFFTFANQGHQSIIVSKSPKFVKKLKYVSFKKRLFTISTKSYLSVSEASDIYHFPFTSTTKTENLVKTLSIDLPAPLSLKSGRELDVVFAKNNYGNSSVDIGLTDEERAKHVYLIGRTGSGKSTVIFHMASQDIQKDRGVCVIDPHGDLAEDLLATVPFSRKDDLIYFNPYDLSHPIGINLLELPEGLTGDDLELEKELVAESVISVFRRVFSKEENTNAHRIEYVLRNTIYTAFYVPDRTIFTIYKLLNNPDFQKKIIATLDDENLKDFWKHEFGRAGNYQIVKMVSGVTAKVGRFLFSPTAKRILEQPKSTINFDEILDQGKILICNISEGNIGEDTAQILGLTIISKIQQAALRRSRKIASTRRPFYLFVDEFQNFATTSFTRILSGGRKFGLRLTLAEQSTAQQQDRNVVNVILANTGTVICFATASPLDEQMMEPQFAPQITKRDIANLPNHTFYIKMSATEPEEPFSGKTIKIDVIRDSQKMAMLIDASRKNYAIVYQKLQPKPVVKAKETVEQSTSKPIGKSTTKNFTPEDEEGK
jgi:energy-coupling factor transporter ATP-binding protein EcfA2